MTPGNHQFIIAEKVEEVYSLGNDKSCHMTAFFIEFQIYNTSYFFTGTDVDHIFFF
jgi:hypothetical protein